MPIEPPDDPTPPHRKRSGKAAKGSAVTALAALTALGSLGTAHAHPSSGEPTPADTTAQHGEAPGRITVRQGDTVWSLATAHGVDVARFMDANGIPAHAMLRPGQQLTVPGKGERTAHEDKPSGSDDAPAPSARHTVARGDTLWDLSQRHRVSVAEILRANDLDPAAALRPGQSLSIPGAGKRPSADRKETTPKPAVGDSFAGRTYHSSVVSSANRHHAQLRERSHPSRERTREMVRRTAQDMGVDPALAMAHASQESGFQQNVVSPADAIGVMQVVPDAGDWASAMVGRDLDLLDAQDNVTAGVAIIKRLQQDAPSKSMGIGAYYQGLHGVRTYGMYSDTKDYVRAVLAQEKTFAG